jgi:peptidoglycan hydrolase-like protein with peptidoglycan-binding domain
VVLRPKQSIDKLIDHNLNMCLYSDINPQGTVMRIRFVLFLATTVLLQWPAQGQGVQRLIIPSSEVSVGPGGTAVIKTYCTDYGIEGPTQGQEYRHLLTAEDSAEVIVGGRRMTLQEAIDNHELKLVTPKATVTSLLADQRMFHNLEPSTSTEDIEWLLRNMSPQERSRFLSEAQNEGELKIVNLSGEKIIFRAKNAALGVSDSAPPLIPEKTTSQTSLWISQIQSRLSSQGYDVQADGILGSSTRSALKDFQAKVGLPATGGADEKTAIKLAEAEDLSELRTLVPDELFVVRLQRAPYEASSLRVTDLDGKRVYGGDDVHSMIDAIVLAAAKNGKPTYIDPLNLSQREIEDLANNLRLVDSEFPIGIFPKPQDSSVPRDVFLSKGATVDAVEVKAEEVATGAKRGWFRSVVRFLTRAHGHVRRVSIEVWTKTSEQMTAFLDSLRAYSPGNTIDNPSIAVIVARGRKAIISGGGETKDVDVQIQSATYRFWASLERQVSVASGL